MKIVISSRYVRIFILFLLINIESFIVSSEKLIHLNKAKTEFEQDNDMIKFELYKNNIIEYYSSGLYDENVKIICKNAQDYFDQLTVHDKSLIILDVDDTALYGHWKSKILNINTKKIRLAILPVLDLYQFLIIKGFKIVFITGRDIGQYNNTKSELENAGYMNFAKLICMPDNIIGEDINKSIAEWKCNVRKELAQEYEIIGSIADRDIDFIGGYSGYEVRLPNYVY